MTTHETQTLSVTIDVPFDTAYEFAWQPENFPRWAAGLSNSLHRTDRGWVADTADGEALVTFSPHNTYGVLDHRVTMAGKPEVYIPLRVVANGDGVEVSLLLLRQPDMTDEMFARDAGAVRNDLAKLKRLLEEAVA